MDSYLTVEAAGTDEFTEKRSRFIGSAIPARTESETAAFISECKAKHHDASHNCSAYVLREGGIQRYSDDGEPQGTAGIPILEVLKKEGISDAVIVVTRYFGGTLLGAGGLIRAYSHAAKIALDAAGRVEMCDCALFSLPVPYPWYERALKLLGQYSMCILDTSFTDAVTLDVRMRGEEYPLFTAALSELSAGMLSPDFIGTEFSPLSKK